MSELRKRGINETVQASKWQQDHSNIGLMEFKSVSTDNTDNRMMCCFMGVRYILCMSRTMRIVLIHNTPVCVIANTY